MKRILILLFCLFFASNSSSPLAAPHIPLDAQIQAASAIVYDMNNEAILFEQNADTPIAPASLTKIMTMFLAMEYINMGQVKLNAPVGISRQAAATGGSRMGLKARETVSLNKLLAGIAVSSGNDASFAVAEFIGGGIEPFVRMMNLKANALGMSSTVFYNPHGLPARGQQTTARDMLALSRAYLKAYPEALNFHNQRTLVHGLVKTWNKNPLLGQYEGADGLKTGWVRASGHNLVFTAVRNGRRLLGVILGASDAAVRGGEAFRLLDAGFLVCANKAVSVASALDTIPLDLSKLDILKTARDEGLLIKRKIVGKRYFAGKSQKNFSRKFAYHNNKGNKFSRRSKSIVKLSAVSKNKLRQGTSLRRKSHASRNTVTFPKS